jgi:hypothetical protein
MGRHAATTAAPKVRHQISAPQVWHDFVLGAAVAALPNNNRRTRAAALCAHLFLRHVYIGIKYACLYTSESDIVLGKKIYVHL